MKSSIYLDYAAATPLDVRVLEAMQPFYSEKFFNPSATYLAAQGVAHDLNDARARIAAQLGATGGDYLHSRRYRGE
jgi:cysteine desulfurase